MIIDHIDHGAGQGGLVGRVVEEGIGGDADFVIEDISIELVEPYRLLISNEVDLVAFVSQGLSKFCGQHTTAAKGGVTDDAYTHSWSFGGLWPLGAKEGYFFDISRASHYL